MARSISKDKINKVKRIRTAAFSELMTDVKKDVITAQQLEDASQRDYIKSMYDTGIVALKVMDGTRKSGDEQLKLLRTFRCKKERSILEAMRVARVYTFDYILSILTKAWDNGVTITWPFIYTLARLEGDEYNEIRAELENKVTDGRLRFSTLKRAVVEILTKVQLPKIQRKIKPRTLGTLASELDALAIYLRQRSRTDYLLVDCAANKTAGVISSEDKDQLNTINKHIAYITRRFNEMGMLMSDEITIGTTEEDLAEQKKQVQRSISERFAAVKQLANQRIDRYQIPITIYDIED